MPTVFVVFTRRRAPSNGKFLLPGTYYNIEDVINFIAPKGPPLPLVVACSEDRVSDLDPLQDAIDRIGGGDTVEGAEAFVKAMIAEVGNLSIWPSHPSFYGLLRSPRVRKLVALDYHTQIVDHISATNDYTIYSFPTFIGAFIYILSGGNGQLRQWDLAGWVGISRSQRAMTPVSPDRPSTSKGKKPSPAPRRQLEGSSRLKEMPKMPVQEEKLQGTIFVGIEDDDPYMVPDTLIKGKQHLQKNLNEARASPRSVVSVPSTSKSTSQPFSLPKFLVPPTYISNPSLLSQPLPFIMDRTTQESRSVKFIASDASIVPSINGPIRDDKTLPPLITRYLLAHGWDASVVDVIGSVYHGNVTMDGFLGLMGRAFSMPLTEAAYLWYLMEHSKSA